MLRKAHMNMEKMKIEIWSDVMCPFCYIGKRKFEAALEKFPHKDRVEIEWKSFQLDPEMKNEPGKDLYSYLAERKGFSLEQSKQMHASVSQMAAAVGLQYDFDRAVIANSFDAHRVMQMAKSLGLGDAAEERIFRAYFTEGKNTGDAETLATLAAEIGMDKEAVLQMLGTDAYADEVRHEIQEGQALGLRGVPFFVIDRKYGVSGAQEPAVFSEALQQSFSEWQKTQPQPLEILSSGASCTPGEACN